MTSSVFVFEVHLEQVLDVDLRHVVDDISVDNGQGSQLLCRHFTIQNFILDLNKIERTIN